MLLLVLRAALLHLALVGLLLPVALLLRLGLPSQPLEARQPLKPRLPRPAPRNRLRIRR